MLGGKSTRGCNFFQVKLISTRQVEGIDGGGRELDGDFRNFFFFLAFIMSALRRKGSREKQPIFSDMYLTNGPHHKLIERKTGRCVALLYTDKYLTLLTAPLRFDHEPN